MHRSKIQATLLNRLYLLQNRQEFWSGSWSTALFSFNMLCLLACGPKSLLSAVSLCVLSEGTWLPELQQGKGDALLEHGLNRLLCPLIFPLQRLFGILQGLVFLFLGGLRCHSEYVIGAVAVWEALSIFRPFRDLTITSGTSGFKTVIMG